MFDESFGGPAGQPSDADADVLREASNERSGAETHTSDDSQDTVTNNTTGDDITAATYGGGSMGGADSF